MSDDNITEIVTEVLPVDPADTQPLANVPERGRRHWVPAAWKPTGEGGGAPKISGGFEVDNRSGAMVPRSYNRPDQRYSQDAATLQAKRTARATDEYPSSVILKGARGIYEVRSASGNNYDVSGDVSRCDCPDRLRLDQSGRETVTCKHQILVQLALDDPALTDGVPWSCEKAAEFVGIDVNTVRRACRDGKIPAVMVHSVWIIQPLDGAQLKFLYTHVPPVMETLTPNGAAAGSGSVAVTIGGSGFNVFSQLVWDTNTVIAPTGHTDTTITATIPAVLLTSPGQHSIKIENAYAGGGTSASLDFTVV